MCKFWLCCLQSPLCAIGAASESPLITLGAPDVALLVVAAVLCFAGYGSSIPAQYPLSASSKPPSVQTFLDVPRGGGIMAPLESELSGQL